MIYIASPYIHKDLAVVQDRARAVAKYAAHLMATGQTCYSPITHGHAIQEYLPENLRGDHKFWLTHDFPFLSKCTAYHLLALDGWEDSKGCRWEYETAKAFKLPALIVTPDSYRSWIMIGNYDDNSLTREDTEVTAIFI